MIYILETIASLYAVGENPAVLKLWNLIRGNDQELVD